MNDWYGYQYDPRGILPPQQVLQVNGRESIEKLRMSPNSSLLAIDQTAPIIWFCSSDGIGTVTATPFDYTRHEDAPEPTIDSVQTQLDELKASVEQILEVLRDGTVKSNTRYVKSKQESSSSE